MSVQQFEEFVGFDLGTTYATRLTPTRILQRRFEHGLEDLDSVAHEPVKEMLVQNGKPLAAFVKFYHPVGVVAGYNILTLLGGQTHTNLTASGIPAMLARDTASSSNGYPGLWKLYMTTVRTENIQPVVADIMIFGSNKEPDDMKYWTGADTVYSSTSVPTGCGGSDHYMRMDGWNQHSQDNPFMVARKSFGDYDLAQMINYLTDASHIARDKEFYLFVQTQHPIDTNAAITARRNITPELVRRFKHKEF